MAHLKEKLDVLLSNGHASLICIEIGSTSYEIYQKLTLVPLEGKKIIGKGEAASIALATEYKGIVASNNLKDISQYMNIYNFRLFTTGDILVVAHNMGIITELHGNAIWSAMLSKRRKLGASSFPEFLNNL